MRLTEVAYRSRYYIATGGGDPPVGDHPCSVVQANAGEIDFKMQQTSNCSSLTNRVDIFQVEPRSINLT